MLKIIVIKQLIVSTSTSALMKLMLALKMNCVLILLDRTNAIPFQVSLRFKSCLKRAKMQEKITKSNMAQIAKFSDRTVLYAWQNRIIFHAGI